MTSPSQDRTSSKSVRKPGSLHSLQLGALPFQQLAGFVNWSNQPDFAQPPVTPWVDLPSDPSNSTDSGSASPAVENAKSVQSTATSVAEPVVAEPVVATEPVAVQSQDTTVAAPASGPVPQAATSDDSKPIAEDSSNGTQQAALAQAQAENEKAEQARLEQAREDQAREAEIEAERQRAAESERAEADRVAAEKRAAEAEELERLEAERAAANLAKAKAAEEQLAAEKLAAEKLAEENRVNEQLAAEKLASDAAKTERSAPAESTAVEKPTKSVAASMPRTEPASQRAPKPQANVTESVSRQAHPRVAAPMLTAPLATRAAVVSQQTEHGSVEDYVARLERLVLELNIELARREDRANKGNTLEELSQRILELNLENLALREQLQESNQ